MNIRIGGAYPLGCGERAIYLGALEHTNYFAAVFRAMWERQGGSWSGKVRDGACPPPRGSSPRRSPHRSPC
jgi:D-alanyl-D-alanine carboxypeptidase/D-alanyl-D-alanine-endopeptidase (penicillin-binding protein 4)